MAGMQLRLQKDLFTPCDEQLLTVVHCFKVSTDKKVNKGNKDIYLCLVNEASNQAGYQVGHSFNHAIMTLVLGQFLKNWLIMKEVVFHLLNMDTTIIDKWQLNVSSDTVIISWSPCCVNVGLEFISLAMYCIRPSSNHHV